MSPSAVEERRLYQLNKLAEGKTVRPYRWHPHKPQHFEDHEAYGKRLHRDRQRWYRGHTEHTVRSWTDLSEMTPDEKTAHRRELANERKRLQRFNERNDPGYRVSKPVSEEDMAELKDLLEELSFD